MGASGSSMAKEDIAHLQNCTQFSLAELEELARRFERLDRDRSGTLSAEELLGIPEFAMNPLAPRILELLHNDREELDFTGFTQLLSVFHSRASRLEKLEFAFKIYNLSGDGYIKKDELLSILRLMAGHNLEEEELQLIVEQTFSIADLNNDGLIDLEEFVSVPSMTKSFVHLVCRELASLTH